MAVSSVGDPGMPEAALVLSVALPLVVLVLTFYVSRACQESIVRKLPNFAACPPEHCGRLRGGGQLLLRLSYKKCAHTPQFILLKERSFAKDTERLKASVDMRYSDGFDLTCAGVLPL